MGRFKLWLAHKLNPAHVFCRFIDFIAVYEKIWSAVFLKKGGMPKRFWVKEFVKQRKLRRKLCEKECMLCKRLQRS